jgi:hypothetical protein
VKKAPALRVAEIESKVVSGENVLPLSAEKENLIR